MSGGRVPAKVCESNTPKWRTHPCRGQQRSGDQSESTSSILNVSENQSDQCDSKTFSPITSVITRKSLVSLFYFHTGYMISSLVGQRTSANTGPHMTSLSLGGRLFQKTWEIIIRSALLLNHSQGEPWIHFFYVCISMFV